MITPEEFYPVPTDEKATGVRIDVTNQFRCVCCGSPQPWIYAHQIRLWTGDGQRTITPLCKECFDYLQRKQ